MLAAKAQVVSNALCVHAGCGGDVRVLVHDFSPCFSVDVPPSEMRRVARISV